MIVNKNMLSALLVAVVVLIVLAKPSARGPQPNANMEAIHSAVKAAGVPRPRAVIDLNAVDRNVDRVVSALGLHHRLRLVTKSIPSPAFIRYVADRAHTHRLMEFHAPFLPELLAMFPEPDLDIMFGKPMPVELAAKVIEGLPSTDQKRALVATQWLVDSHEAVDEYLAWGQRLRAREPKLPPLRLALEIDVGLHRGGFTSPESAALAAQNIQKAGAVLSGLMGYDGHVGYAPRALGPRGLTVAREMRALAARYDEFTRAVTAATKLRPDQLTLNGGGSRTYMQYSAGVSALMDIALGSAFLQPADFDSEELAAHEPALLIAAPVIKVMGAPAVPFVGSTAGRLWSVFDPNMAQGFFVYGGGWAHETYWPSGLHTHPLYDHAPNRNLLPNQDLYTGSKKYTIKRGDYLFFRPLESDLLFDFEEILAVRGGKLEKRWHPFSVRF